MSEKEIEILQFVAKNYGIVFQDLMREQVNPYDKTTTYKFNECTDLINQGFIVPCKISWYSYALSPLGKYFLDEN